MSNILRLTCLFLPVLVLSVPLNATAQGVEQKYGSPQVIVQLGRPNVWTMDQAHYLLERNRTMDLQIAQKPLEQLDPNSTNGVRITQTTNSFGAAAGYDQSIGIKSRTDLGNYEVDRARYRAALSEQDRASKELQAALAEQARAQKAQDDASASGASDVDAKKTTLVSTTALVQIKQSAYDNISKQVSAPIAPTLGTGSASISSLPGTDSSEAFYRAAADLSKQNLTKIAASQQLENHINLQYEMVAKQLTLLRDQAGPDNMVLFLELPQSIYLTNKFRPYPYLSGLWGAHAAQSWWRMDAALVVNHPLDKRGPTISNLKEYLREPAKYLVNKCDEAYVDLTMFYEPNSKECREAYKKVHGGSEAVDRKNNGVDEKPERSQRGNFANPFLREQGALRAESKADPVQAPSRSPGGEVVPSCTQRKGDLCSPARDFSFSMALSATEQNRPNTADATYLASPDMQQLSSPAQALPMYTLDLIPRQSALNVAESNSTTSNISLSALFKFISGVGLDTKYQRQRNEFSQFLQQETYASAFGKGSYEFGWTFGPLPGTNRLAPGLRTTYAVVVVPRSTRVLRLYGVGCGYRRRDVPKDPFRNLEWKEADFHPRHIGKEECSELSTFDVEVPDNNDNLGVDTATYSKVTAGRRAMVEIKGRFDEQVGVLVNGTPLTKLPSLAQPNMVDKLFNNIDAAAGESTIKGVYEVVSNSQLLVTFVLPQEMPSKPEITLVTAGKAVTVTADMWRDRNAPLAKPADGVIFHKTLKIQTANLSLTDSTDRGSDVKVTVLGSGFLGGNMLTLTLGNAVLTRAPDNTVAPGKNQFVPKNGNVIVVNVPREEEFNATAVYLTRLEEDDSTTIDHWVVKDDFGPLFKDCTVSNDKKTLTQTGKFFSATYEPKLNGDGVSAVNTSRSEIRGTWTVTAPEGSAWWAKQSLPGESHQSKQCIVLPK